MGDFHGGDLDAGMAAIGSSHLKQAKINKLGVKVKFADFQLTTIEHLHSSLELDDFRHLLESILQRQHEREIRLLGLTVMLKPEELNKQLSFF